MAIAVVRSRGLAGLSAPSVEVEVHVGTGLPAFHIVGLPEAEVRESRERVRAALTHSGFEFPNRRIAVNLAPADLPKESGRFDLPIAIGLLVASGQLPTQGLQELEMIGELSLTGALRPVRGALAMALACHSGAAAPALLVPRGNCIEAALVRDLCVYGASSLAEVCAHLGGTEALPRIESVPAADLAGTREHGEDFADVRGHREAKRALEIAAAGSHSLLMVGPPGAGKSMLATRLPTILPPLDEDTALETAAIAGLRGGFDPRSWRTRPFRAPHHSASAAALVGGGAHPRPGEASLAHHGVLFLDELPEFNRAALEGLREPLETGHIAIARALHRVEFPARFQLVAAMNPCACGHFGSPRCRCTPNQVLHYQRRISGPLLDRIDLQIRILPVAQHTLGGDADGEPSATIAERVCLAHQRQQCRQGKPNAALGAAEIHRHCALPAESAALLERAAMRLHWSSRSAHRVQKLARTICDLDGETTIAPAHVAEAIGYRRALFAPATAQAPGVPLH